MRFLTITIAIAVAILGAQAAHGQIPAIDEPAPIVEPVPPTVPTADDAMAGSGEPNILDGLSTPIRTVLLLSLLTLLPGMLLTLTSYTRIIIVLSFVKRAIGAQELPPGPILIGLALFLTGAIMSPTLGKVYDTSVQPYLDGNMSLSDSVGGATDELKDFMMVQTRQNDLTLALELADAPTPQTAADVPFRVAVPAFILSELRTAFRMGFIIYLPFVLIDLVVASVLLALGMFMLPPTMIAMPLKILLFILVDGWTLIIQSLHASFGAA